MEPIEQRKLFVGGVSRDTNEDTLREYFSQFGTVEEPLIIRHRHTGVGRGFGFVIFSAVSMVKEALQHENHVILGKKVEVKRAIPKGHRQEDSNGYSSNNGDGVTEINNNKIFVGGLPPDLKEDEFKSYFESFGTVIDAPVMIDKVTGQPRRFGFITFDSEEAVDNVLRSRFHQLKNKMVEVKRAHPKESNDKYMNFCDGNNATRGLAGGFLYGYSYDIYYCYPYFQTHEFYSGRSSYGLGGWGSPSNLIGTSPSRGLLAVGNPAVPVSFSNGDYDSSVVEVPETRKSPQTHDLSSLRISGIEHQEGKMDDSLSSKSNAAENQIAEIHDLTIQKPMLEDTKSEQNEQPSHDSHEESEL